MTITSTTHQGKHSYPRPHESKHVLREIRTDTGGDVIVAIQVAGTSQQTWGTALSHARPPSGPEQHEVTKCLSQTVLHSSSPHSSLRSLSGLQPERPPTLHSCLQLTKETGLEPQAPSWHPAAPTLHNQPVRQRTQSYRTSPSGATKCSWKSNQPQTNMIAMEIPSSTIHQPLSSTE
jgi:hypothetical protein